MLDAFIDNTVVKEQVIHKIVEVKVWDEYHKKKEKENFRVEESDTAESQLDVGEDEMAAIKADTKTLK